MSSFAEATRHRLSENRRNTARAALPFSLSGPCLRGALPGRPRRLRLGHRSTGVVASGKGRRRAKARPNHTTPSRSSLRGCHRAARDGLGLRTC